MSAAEVVSDVLLGVGCVVLVLGSFGALARVDALERIHLLAPVTSLGLPLIAAAAAVHLGWGLAAGTVIVIAVISLWTGPTVSAATARLVRERTSGQDEEPE